MRILSHDRVPPPPDVEPITQIETDEPRWIEGAGVWICASVIFGLPTLALVVGLIVSFARGTGHD
jgi:hypothetical protein